jgi:hypothetical protein
MSNESDQEKNNKNEENIEWGKYSQLPIFDNLMPVLKSMILMVESEKKKTLEKIEQTKKVLEKIKDNKK